MNPPSDCYRRGKNFFISLMFSKVHSPLTIADYGEKESVDEIRHRINSLRQMVEEEVGEKQLEDLKKSSKKRTESMDTGSLLSFTFGRICFISIAKHLRKFLI
jgi:hypothetical protein